MTFGNRRMASIVLTFGIFISILGLTGHGPFISGARDYAQKIAISSATTYMSLRLINAAISFAEEVEVGGSVVAVSGSAHPFKVLEPIDDAVERLSSAIFAVGVVTGVLTVVLPVLGGVTLAMIGASLVVWATMDLTRLSFSGRHFVLTFCRGVARLGLLGFMIIIAFSISSWFADGVSDRAWGQYQHTLSDFGNQMPKKPQESVSTPAADQITGGEDANSAAENDKIEQNDEAMGFLDKAISALKSTGEGAANIASSAAAGVNDLAGGAVEGLTEAAASATASYKQAREILEVISTRSDELVFALMGVFAAFLFKTFICPMLLLIGLWKLVGNFDYGTGK